jgi:hypothetical protein
MPNYDEAFQTGNGAPMLVFASFICLVIGACLLA